MKAAVLKAARTKLEIEERSRLRPAPGEVLIRIRACGVCHGDIMLEQGEFPFARYPIVPGHEVAGVVEEVGEGVNWPDPGARVGLSALFSSCGLCKQCRDGHEQLCAEFQFTGVTKDGGYQQFMVAPAGYVTPLPDALDFAEAAPLMCAGLTMFSALRHSGFQAGDKVAVIGLGGLGHLGVLYAKAMGGRVAVVSTKPDKEADARKLGAEQFILSKSAGTGEALRAWEGGADVILATAPAIESLTAAISGLAPDATLIILAAPMGQVAVNPIYLIAGRRRVMGSTCGSRSDLRETLEFAATHGIRPWLVRYRLEDASDALAQMHRSPICGRAVLVMD